MCIAVCIMVSTVVACLGACAWCVYRGVHSGMRSSVHPLRIAACIVAFVVVCGKRVFTVCA